MFSVFIAWQINFARHVRLVIALDSYIIGKFGAFEI